MAHRGCCSENSVSNHGLLLTFLPGIVVADVTAALTILGSQAQGWLRLNSDDSRCSMTVLKVCVALKLELR